MMNKKIYKKIDDEVIYKLLSLNEHEKAKYSVDLEEKTDNIIKNFFKNPQTLSNKNISENKSLFDIFIFNPVPSFAFLIILALIGIFIITDNFMFNNLNDKLYVSNYDKSDKDSYTLEKERNITTNQYENLILKSQKFIFLLKSDSKLKIISNNGIFGNKKDQYYLTNGILYVDANNLSKNDILTIKTKLASIKVVGTRFLVDINEKRLIVRCFEGKVVVSSTHLKDGNKILTDGNMIIIEPQNSTIKSNDLTDDFFNIKTKDKELEEKKTDKIEKTDKNEEKIKIVDKIDKEDSIKENIFKPITREWNIKLKKEKHKEIFVFGGTVGIVSTDNTLSLYDYKSNYINEYSLPKNAESFSNFHNNFVWYLPPNNITITSIPDFNDIFKTTAGPIAFGKPEISEKYLVIASTDRNLYIYNYLSNRNVGIIEFDAGFYSTPLIDVENIVISTVSKKVTKYSINNNLKLWEYSSDE
ncbi:MAG TPA: FecR family protein, partial [Spirochaetota bacterium]|nr:FecR family protein [Spirochaetota bacterium]